MKKLMALCLSLLMVLSMCSFTAMAAEVDFAEIANGQPQKFVTSNLVLGEHTITSSNTAVIAEDGTVTRPLFEDEIVKISVGSSSYDVTVKSMMVNPVKYTDFTVTNETNVADFSGFSEDAVGTTTLENGAAKVTLQGSSQWMQFNVGGTAQNTETRTMSFKVADLSSSASGEMVDIRPIVYLYDADGNKVKDISGSTLFRASGSNKFSDYTSSGITSAEIGSTITLKMIDSVLYVSTGGEFIDVAANHWDISTVEGATRAVLGGIIFRGGSSSALGSVTIDDMVYYTDADSSSILANATKEQKLNYFATYLTEDYVANGGAFAMQTKDLKFTAPDLTEDASLVWETDENVISSDGKLKRGFETIITTIKGTLKVGELTATKTYTVNVAPLTIAQTSEYIDFESSSELLADAAWTKKASFLDVSVAGDSSNHYAKISTSSGNNDSGTTGALTYDFKNVPSVTDVLYYGIKMRVHVLQTPGSAINIALNLGGKKSAEFDLGSAGRTGIIYGSALSDNAWHTGAEQIDRTKNISTPTSTFVDLEMKIDVANKKVYYYQNGNHTETATYNYEKFTPDLTSVETATLSVNWRSASGEIWLDDVFLYTETNVDSAISALNDTEKVAYFKALVGKSAITTKAIAVDADLTLDAGYASYDLEKCGITIDWTSSVPSVIANDGKVTLPESLFRKDVTMTATIKAGNVTDTVVFPLKVVQAGTLAAGHIFLNSEDFEDPDSRLNLTLSGTPEGVTAGYVTDDDEHDTVYKLSGTQAGVGASVSNSGLYLANSHNNRYLISTEIKYERLNKNGIACGVFSTVGTAGKVSNTVTFDFYNRRVGLTTAKTKRNTQDVNYVEYYDMPESVKEGEWFDMLIDYNVMSKTYQVYLNGEAINEIPVIKNNLTEVASGNTYGFRGIQLSLSNDAGSMYMDNLTVRQISDTSKVAVNAALNAALIAYAQEIHNSSLVNQDLMEYTIANGGTADGSNVVHDSTDIINNPARYTYNGLSDGGAKLTYTVNNNPATAINADRPGTAEITITSTLGSVSESKTFTRKIAPADIRFVDASSSALNYVSISGEYEGAKIIIASYSGDKMIRANVANAADADETGALPQFSGINMVGSIIDEDTTVTAIKVMMVSADGITPIAHYSLLD